MKSLQANLSLTLLAAGLALCGPAPAQTADAPRPKEPAMDPGNMRAYIALARADLKTEKTLIIAQNISFTEDEAVEFWPLHSEYTLALNKLLDQRLNLLSEYATTYKTMTDKQASGLARQVFDWEQKRVDLKRTWFNKFAKAVPAKKAAQFFQIENQINAALDLQLAAALPLIK